MKATVVQNSAYGLLKPIPGRFTGISHDRVKSLFVSMHSDSLLSNVLSLLQWVSQVQKRSCCVCMDYQSFEWSEAAPV